MNHLVFTPKGRSYRWVYLGLFCLLGPLQAQEQPNPAKETAPTEASEPIAPAVVPTPPGGEVEESPKPSGRTRDDGPGFSFGHRGSHGRPDVYFGEDVVIEAGETVDDLVVIGGRATIHGRVRHDAVVIGGNLDVTGEVGRDLVVVLGSSSLGPKAAIGGDYVVVGGRSRLQAGAQVDGERVNVPFMPFVGDGTAMLAFFQDGLFKGRTFAPTSTWSWGIAGAFAVLYLLLALLFPRPIAACVDALQTRPIASFFSGVGAFILIGPVVIILLISILGIFALPFLACAMVLALLFGRVAVYEIVGVQLGRQLGVGVLQRPLLALLVGLGLMYVVFAVPILGLFVSILIVPLGLGAVVVASATALRRDPPPARPQGHPPSSSFVPPTGPNPGLAGGAFDPAQPPPVSAGSSTLTSAQAVSLPRAGFWRRACATFLDAVLVVWTVVALGPGVILLWVAYHVGMWWWKGTTIGGIILGIQCVRADGRPMDFGVSLVRSLASFFSALVLGLGFFWAGWDREKQSWHDKIAGTVVVKLPRGISLL